MCGRYYMDRDVEKEIYRIAQEIDENMRRERSGDIYPSWEAPVLYGRGDRLCGGAMIWGLPGKDGKLLINARAETALERPAFAGSVRRRRCVIPARHFYEWDGDRQKATFYRRGKALYFAGFYRGQGEGPRFIILTTAANESVRPVHHRMPLILEEEEIRLWIEDDSGVEHFLRKSPPLLERRQDYQQMSLF